MAIPSNIVPFVKPQRRDGADDVQGPIEEARGSREGSGAKPASRVWIIVLLILLFGGFALIFGGEWGPSTGAAGLAMQACQGVGLITFGISLAMTARLLHLQHRTKTTGTPAAPNERTRDALRREYVQELVMLAPAVAAYAGCALLYLTGVSFLEDETALNLIIMMAFAGGAVALAALVHRRRKRRGVSYKHLGNAGLIAFCLAFAVGGALIGWDIAWRGCGRCGKRPRYGAMLLSRLRHRQAHRSLRGASPYQARTRFYQRERGRHHAQPSGLYCRRRRRCSS